MEVTGQEYRQMNKKVAPKSPVFTNCLKAFLIGGGICTLAEVIVQLLQTYAGMEQKEARLVGSIALIFLSILLTGLNVYDNIAKHAGGHAGAHHRLRQCRRGPGHRIQNGGACYNNPKSEMPLFQASMLI